MPKVEKTASGPQKKRVTFEDLGFVPVLFIPGVKGKARMVKRSMTWWQTYKKAMGQTV